MTKVPLRPFDTSMICRKHLSECFLLLLYTPITHPRYERKWTKMLLFKKATINRRQEIRYALREAWER